MAAAAGLLAASLAAPAAVAASEGFKTKLTPEEALRALRDGNERFVSDAPFRPEIGTARQTETSKGQGPFASFVSCADSRVSPELVFSRGIGELFVVRSAGNIADAVALGGRHGREERHLPPAPSTTSCARSCRRCRRCAASKATCSATPSARMR